MANLDFNEFGCIRMPEVSEAQPRQRFTWNPPENLPVNPSANLPTVTPTSNSSVVPPPLPGNGLPPQPSAFSRFWWPMMRGGFQILAILGMLGAIVWVAIQVFEMVLVLVNLILEIVVPCLVVVVVLFFLGAIASNTNSNERRY